MHQSPSISQRREEKEHVELLPAIEELRGPIKKLLNKLRPHIEKGEYQLLISDEASGRIPSLILLRLINEVYKEKGYPHLVFFALSGGGSFWDYDYNQKPEDIAGYLTRILPKTRFGNKAPLKALIVTDTIYNGKTFEVFNIGLSRANIQSDTATVGVDGPMKEGDSRHRLETMYQTHIFWGMEGTPQISGREDLSGVRTIDPFHLQTRTITDPDVVATRIRARRDVRTLTHELVKWYKQQ
ncbi:MAG: hypothetical protein KGI50_03985 [Patescibacteria group bacterium]|nr:hypothetical protein [Patescibacteria group bacterium]MDE2438847.1 hypothetical protein [Patescibacteria group bacterium]